METPAIDEKKQKKSKPATSVYSFIGSMILSLLTTVIYFMISGLILYSCKIAQSNILPTDLNCAPYTNSNPEIEKVVTDIFTTWGNPPESNKLGFPFDGENKKNTVLDILRNYKNEPQSNFLFNYFIAIIESLIQLDYSVLTFVLNTLNGFSEFFVVLTAPVIMFFVISGLFLLNNIYFGYLWFYNMFWFFKTNSNTSKEGLPNWKQTTFTDPINMGFAGALVFLFIILFFVLMFMIPFFPALCLAWCVLTVVGIKGVMDEKEISVGGIIQLMFRYYKTSIMSIIMFFLVLHTFTQMGNIAGGSVLAGLLLLAFVFTKLNVFGEDSPTNLTAITGTKQAIKTCK